MRNDQEEKLPLREKIIILTVLLAFLGVSLFATIKGMGSKKQELCKEFIEESNNNGSSLIDDLNNYIKNADQEFKDLQINELLVVAGLLDRLQEIIYKEIEELENEG